MASNIEKVVSNLFHDMSKNLGVTPSVDQHQRNQQQAARFAKSIEQECQRAGKEAALNIIKKVQDALKTAFDSVDSDLASQAQRIAELETHNERLTELETKTARVAKSVAKTKSDLANLEAKIRLS